MARAKYGEPLKWARAAARTVQADCLEWPFGVNAKGYGYVRNGALRTHAHRLVCILAHGEPPSKTEVAHSCCNRLCCNPAHLRHATSVENSRDTLEHGNALLGDRSPSAKLTEADARAIRKACDAGANQSELARRYGVSPKAVNFIARRINWAWLPEGAP